MQEIDRSVSTRFSDASVTSRMCAGRLSSPIELPFSNFTSNFVAITTRSRSQGESWTLFNAAAQMGVPGMNV